MSSSFASKENKKTKPLRLLLCTSFVLEILALAMPYIATVENNTYYFKTMFQLIITMMNTNETEWIKMGVIAIAFAVIPIVGFFFAVFDKNSLLKCVVGCICSFLGIFAIVFIIPQFSSVLAFGAMISIMLYLFAFVISVSLALKILGVRALKKQEEQLAKERNEA